MNNRLVSMYGTMWARNKKNIEKLNTLHKDEKLLGVYVLCDGSMPVYIGRGKIARRIDRHRRSKSKGQFWDHFSWFSIPDRSLEADVEALLLRMLPFYLRSLNKQRTKFVGHHKIEQVSPTPDVIERPNFPVKRKQRAKRKQR